MAARKLQQEIDKTFKKISEGRQAFDQLYDKIQQTTNAAQKEKLEDNLKREIKKLQRNRDQIKTWCAGNEIKDKKPLMEQRKLIENEMERFKAVEKEMKTKAFSKEGLSAASRLDPKEQEKADAATFLSEMVEELDRQIESLEAEQESLEATVKKGKKDTSRADRLAEIARLTEQHRWHQGKLELLLRSLQNGNVGVDQLTDVKEGIKYYVEENQTPEFMEDDTLYDEFDLDADEGAWAANNELDKVTSLDASSTADDALESTNAPPPPIKQKSSSDGPGTSGRRPSTTLKSPLPALATLHAPSNVATASSTASNMKPAPPPTRAPGETLKYASAAAAAAASEKGGIAPLPPAPGAAASNLVPLPSAPSKGSATTSPNVAASVPVPSVHRVTSTDSANVTPIGKAMSAGSVTTSSQPPTPALEKSETASSAKGKAAQTLPPAREEREESPEAEQPKTPPMIPAATTTAQTNGGPTIKEEEEESIFHLPAGLQDLLQSFEITKERVKAEPSPAAHRLLEVSQTSCPDPLEGDKPFHYRPQNKYMTPAFYPQEPSQIAEDPALYSRIDTDTLFFIFYYRQGTYQQYLAAKSLKSQSWRFHKQYQTWFQRHEEPKTITEEFEQGTYRFFDYESTWMNRRKADFKFAYKFLEDDL